MDMREVKHAMYLQECRDMIAARQESGMTVTRWCEANGLNENTYYHRVKQLRQAAIAERLAGFETQQMPTLVKVEMAPEEGKSGKGSIELTISGGTLNIPVGTKAEAIVEVLKAMRSCAV